MNFKNNEARMPGYDEFQVRMNFNTMRSKKDFNNRTRECCMKHKGNLHTTKHSRSKTMRNASFGRNNTINCVHTRGKSYNGTMINIDQETNEDDIDDVDLQINGEDHECDNLNIGSGRIGGPKEMLRLKLEKQSTSNKRVRDSVSYKE